MTSSMKKLQPASPINFEMPPMWPPASFNVVDTVAKDKAKAVGMVDVVDAVDMAIAVDPVATVKVVDPETATIVCPPNA
jgi:hypothetical protein